MAARSAFTALAVSHSDDDETLNADDSLPSLADSFHSDVERDRQDRDLGIGASRNGWAGGARADPMRRERAGANQNGRPRSRSPRSDPDSPGTPHQRQYPQSSLADMPTPRPNQTRSPSSSMSNLISDDDDDLFAQTPVGPPPKQNAALSRAKNGQPTRSGRLSAAGGDRRAETNMTLRDQEKLTQDMAKEILALKWKITFYEDRLRASMPETSQALMEEIAGIRHHYELLKTVSKKNKKFALESQVVIEELKKEINALHRQADASGGSSRELKQERARTKELEDELKQERARADKAEKELRDGEGKRRRETDNVEAEVARLRTSNDEIEAEAEGLARELEDAKAKLEDNHEEIAQLQDELDRRNEADESRQQTASADDLHALQTRLDELEPLVESLEADVAAKTTSIATLEDEREELLEERDELNRQLDALEDGHRDRSLNRAGDEEQSEQERDSLRDQLAAASLELEKKEAELDDKEKALQEAYEELDGTAHQWGDELKETKQQNEQLKDALHDREKENHQLRDQIQDHVAEIAELKDKLAEVEQLCDQITDKLEDHLSACEPDKAEREAELIANNEEIQALGERIHELEDELESRIANIQTLEEELNAADAAYEEAQVTHDKVIAGLRDKLDQANLDKQEIAELYDASLGDKELHEHQLAELTRKVIELDEAVRSATSARKRALEDKAELGDRLRREEEARARDTASWKREKQDDEAHWNRLLEDKEASVSRLNGEFDQIRTRLAARDRDLEQIQEGSRQLGETHTNDRFALELEVERVRRDLERAEDDLERLKRELDKKELVLGQREDALAEMHATSRELENKLSAERQARLNVSDKLDAAQKTGKAAESEASSLRERVDDLELRLSSDQRDLLLTKNKSEAQRVASNELLQSVFQSVNKILGTEERGTTANFAVFKDTLLARLRSLAQLQTTFEKKVKLTEAGFVDKLGAMKKQLDHKWRQLDQFEQSVRKLELVKTSWRNKFAQKQGELDALQSQHADLAAQLASLKGIARSDSSNDLRSANTRNATLERRLANAQNQLSTYDDKMASARTKMSAAEARWDARVREYESRLKQAEEKIKAEKQGGKERAAQLEAQVKDLEKQIEIAKRRNDRVRELLPPPKPPLA